MARDEGGDSGSCEGAGDGSVEGDGEDRFGRELRELGDDVRAAAAVAERRRRSMLHRQAAESGTLAGTLADLAERGATVAIGTGDGHVSRGAVRAVGADHVVLRDRLGRTVLVCLDAAAVVAVEPGTAPTVGDRAVAASGTLLEVLSRDAERPVLIRTMWGESVAGSLKAVGSDVLTVRTATGRSVYVARSAVTEVTLT